jgi:hypothetical protein
VRGRPQVTDQAGGSAVGRAEQPRKPHVVQLVTVQVVGRRLGAPVARRVGVRLGVGGIDQPEQQVLQGQMDVGQQVGPGPAETPAAREEDAVVELFDGLEKPSQLAEHGRSGHRVGNVHPGSLSDSPWLRRSVYLGGSVPTRTPSSARPL